MKRGRPKGIPDSYSRLKNNYKGGVKGRKDKQPRVNYGCFRRWELKRTKAESKKYGVSFIKIDEAEIQRRYLLKQYCCDMGMIGRKLRSNQVKRLNYKQTGLLPLENHKLK